MKRQRSGTEEIRYICKVCKKPFYIPEKVYKLMVERGESLPERCELHRKEHKKEIRYADICIPYFEVELKEESGSFFDFYNSLYTFHGERTIEKRKKQPELSRDIFKITDEHILDLYQKLERYQAIVLISPTGTGKSVFIPFRLIFPPQEGLALSYNLVRQGQLIQTQPLSSATERIPEIKRKLTGVSKVGALSIFGLRHRGKEEYDKKNIEITVTDGSLKNWIRDGLLTQYSLVMIDEAHKRTINIDNILMLLIRELPKNPHLRVIISSATINSKDFKKALEEGGIPTKIFDLSNRIQTKNNYFIHFWKGEKEKDCDCWLCEDSTAREKFWKGQKSPPKESELPEVASEFVMEILRKTKKGSVLVFLPGKTLIRKTVKLIQSKKREIDSANEIPVLGIFSCLGEKEVERLFNLKGKQRRILITTDIAETSHTLEDVVYVIDSGYQKEPEWDPETSTMRLKTKRHSQAGCKQRWGRVGRIQKGYVYCLYTKDQFENEFKKYTEPEIFKSPLNETLLTLKAAGINKNKEVPLIGKPQDKEGKERIKKEVERALEEIKIQGQISEKGVITEDALEIFHTPLSPDKISFLKLSDEMNCLLEAALMLFLSSTDENEPRTGTGLYNPYHGLLRWNEHWKASTKEKVYQIHQALKVGCQDDLDFIMKIAFLVKRNGKNWAKRHFLNEEIIEIISKAEKFINDKYRQKVKEEEIRREINWRAVNKVRLISSLIFPHRIVDIRENNIVNLRTGEKIKRGVISKHCNGDWQNKDKAICLSSSEEEIILDAQKQLLPVASFLIRLYEKSKEINRNYLFADQKFPIGSLVSVKEENGRSYIEKLLEKPSPIRIRYNKPIDPSELENIGKEEELEFEDKWIIEDSDDKEIKIEGIWIEGGKDKKARIIGWREMDGKPFALLSSPEKTDFAELQGKLGEQVKVKIEKIIRHPSRGGWVLARLPNSFLIPIEISEISLDSFGLGLEMIEGETVTLTIRGFDEDCIPLLSNIDKIIADLESIRKKISKEGDITPESKRKYIDFAGRIVDIDANEEKISVGIKRENGIVHSFEVTKDYIPEESIDNLKIGEKVSVRLLPREDKDKISLYYFTKEEIESIPKNWKIDRETDRISLPFCLKKIENWYARPEAINFVIRHSWRYFLNARITNIGGEDEHVEKVSKFLKVGDRVKGTVIGYKYRKDGEISGIKVKIEVDTPQGEIITSGFVPKSKLRKPVHLYHKGEEISLIIIDVPGLVFKERF